MKMKRIAAAMLAMMMVVSLSACGTNNENTGASPEETSDVQISTERTDEQADPAESNTESSAEVIVTTTETTAPEVPEEPEEIPVMTVEPTLIMNGSMAFKHNGKNYVYNITENELYETEYDVNDITVLKGCVAVVGNVSSTSINSTTAKVVNLKTDLSYDDAIPVYTTNWNGNYLTVMKIEKGFSNNLISIGMIDNNGEWKLPLSSEYAINEIKNLDKVTSVYQNDKLISLTTNNGDVYNYNIAKNVLIENLNVKDITDDDIIVYDFDETEATVLLYNYDIINNEKTRIGILSDFYDRNVAKTHWSDDFTRIYVNYELSNYNLSEYKVQGHIRGASETAIVFVAMNNDGDKYNIILNQNGDNICEPFINDNGYKTYFGENKIMLVAENTDRIIDINTGAITEYDSTFDIIDYDDTNDLMLVNTNGAYYLVDTETPDVLINPFERAKN